MVVGSLKHFTPKFCFSGSEGGEALSRLLHRRDGQEVVRRAGEHEEGQGTRVPHLQDEPRQAGGRHESHLWEKLFLQVQRLCDFTAVKSSGKLLYCYNRGSQPVLKYVDNIKLLCKLKLQG